MQNTPWLKLLVMVALAGSATAAEVQEARSENPFRGYAALAAWMGVARELWALAGGGEPVAR
jgi:hypothetical protein